MRTNIHHIQTMILFYSRSESITGLYQRPYPEKVIVWWNSGNMSIYLKVCKNFNFFFCKIYRRRELLWESGRDLTSIFSLSWGPLWFRSPLQTSSMFSTFLLFFFSGHAIVKIYKLLLLNFVWIKCTNMDWGIYLTRATSSPISYPLPCRMS